MKGFLGKEGFVWWHGVVEDVNDPLQIGRCRVRIFGFHVKDKVQLPTNDLPWAFPMQSLASAALSGVGQSPTGLLVGSHVFGFFRDGEEGQDPVMIGSFGGIPQTAANTSEGFSDPSGKYPATPANVSAGIFPLGVSVVGEQDTNRLARNSNTEQMKQTVVGAKASTVKQNIQNNPDMKAKSTWSEPVTPYAAQYPRNHVSFSQSGHVREVDDTPGAERLHDYHQSGTFTEVGNGWQDNPDGTRVQRIVGDDYEIVHGNKKIYIAGSQGVDLVIAGGMNITVSGAVNLQVNGNADILANANVNLQVEGEFKASAKTMEFYTDGDIGFSGRTISFMTDSAVMVMQQGKRIEVNSGEPVVKPKRVDLR
jgi:hypothetical protein